jgi:hypothetical protein
MLSGSLASDSKSSTLHRVSGKLVYATSVDQVTQNRTVESKIPWTALPASFDGVSCPPAVGDKVGFSLLGIDYGRFIVEWFGCINIVPWQGMGLQTMTFIE